MQIILHLRWKSWVLGHRFLVLGPKFQVPGPRSWVLQHRSWVMGPGSCVLGPFLSFWQLGVLKANDFSQVPRSWDSLPFHEKETTLSLLKEKSHLMALPQGPSSYFILPLRAAWDPRVPRVQ